MPRILPLPPLFSHWFPTGWTGFCDASSPADISAFKRPFGGQVLVRTGQTDIHGTGWVAFGGLLCSLDLQGALSVYHGMPCWLVFVLLSLSFMTLPQHLPPPYQPYLKTFCRQDSLVGMSPTPPSLTFLHLPAPQRFYQHDKHFENKERRQDRQW